MSFNTALAACWDICQRNCRSAFLTDMSRTVNEFYETYPLSDDYTQRSLPPEPYRTNHKVSQVIEEEEDQTTYHVQVGLVSVESKLVNSFLGLPFALLESLAFLTALIYQPLLLSILCVIFTPIVMLISPFMLFVDPATALLLFISPVIGALIVIALTVYNALQIPYRLLKSLAKIPVGLGIGIWALVQLARGQSVNPPNIQELQSGRVDQGINLSARFDDIYYVNKNNPFEMRLAPLKGTNNLDLPERYTCPIALTIIYPVLLSDGHAYSEYSADRLFNEKANVQSPSDNSLKIDRYKKIDVNTYRNEVDALVRAIERESDQATDQGREPNYTLIMNQASQNQKIADKLYEIINTGQFEQALLRRNNSKLTFELTRENNFEFAFSVDGENYKFTLSKQIIEDTFKLIEPIVGDCSHLDTDPILALSGPKGFLKRAKHEHKNLFVVGLKETLLATQNLAEKFDLLSSPQASSTPSPAHSTFLDQATSVGKTFLPMTGLF